MNQYWRWPGRSVKLAPMPPDSPENQRQLGYRSYSQSSLRLYDLWVLGLSCHLLWRCPTRHVSDLYQKNVSANHLDVGVGTGYFLDRTQFPSASPRLALLDLSDASLAFTARRLARYHPAVVRADVLAPLPPDIEPFDSIGVNFILHCLPGPIARKAAAFDNLAALLRPGGVIFGSTLLSHGKTVPLQARPWMAAYNALGIFDNRRDTARDLRSALESRFVDVSMTTRGAVAMFSARSAG